MYSTVFVFSLGVEVGHLPLLCRRLRYGRVLFSHVRLACFDASFQMSQPLEVLAIRALDLCVVEFVAVSP